MGLWTAMLWLLCAAGVGVVVRGWRGHRLPDATCCRGCGYEVPTHSRRCSECGRWLAESSHRIAVAMQSGFFSPLLSTRLKRRREHRWRVVGAGVALVVFGTLGLNAGSIGAALKLEPMAMRSTGSLIRQIERAATLCQAADAMRELVRRQERGALARASSLRIEAAIRSLGVEHARVVAAGPASRVSVFSATGGAMPVTGLGAPVAGWGGESGGWGGVRSDRSNGGDAPARFARVEMHPVSHCASGVQVVTQAQIATVEAAKRPGLAKLDEAMLVVRPAQKLDGVGAGVDPWDADRVFVVPREWEGSEVFAGTGFGGVISTQGFGSLDSVRGGVAAPIVGLGGRGGAVRSSGMNLALGAAAQGAGLIPSGPGGVVPTSRIGERLAGSSLRAGRVYALRPLGEAIAPMRY